MKDLTKAFEASNHGIKNRSFAQGEDLLGKYIKRHITDDHGLARMTV